MKLVPFVKAAACGNDFLLVEAKDFPGNKADFTRQICDRHWGVGADGVEWLSPAASADVEIHLVNADGSAAEISGNGTRCVAANWVAGKAADRVTIQTDAGPKVCKLVRRSAREFEFETEMGKAEVGVALSMNVESGAA